MIKPGPWYEVAVWRGLVIRGNASSNTLRSNTLRPLILSCNQQNLDQVLFTKPLQAL